MIQAFKDASSKGLQPEDYDASRWDGRLRSVRDGGIHVATFDTSLTVSAMRFVSDLHIGRINPKHVNFGA